LKPVTYCARPMCGLDFTYKVKTKRMFKKMRWDQYVNVRFLSGDIILPGESRSKVSFYVSDTLSSSADNDD